MISCTVLAGRSGSVDKRSRHRARRRRKLNRGGSAALLWKPLFCFWSRARGAVEIVRPSLIRLASAG